MHRFKVVWELLKETFSEWSEDKASRLAAALAYYTAVPLAPLVILILAMVGLVFGQDLINQHLTKEIGNLIGQEGATVIALIIKNASEQPKTGTVAAVVSLGALLFGASGVFSQLQDALNTVWEVAPKPGLGIVGFIKTRFLSFTMILGIGFLLLVSLLLSISLSAVLTSFSNYLTSLLPEVNLALGQIVDLVISFGVVTLLFAMIYKILPDVEINWSDVWIGAAVTAFLFIIGKFLISLYLGTQSLESTYGAAGSIVVLLLWVYYSAQILLFGAEFTQVYAKKFGSQIVPSPDAISLTPENRAEQGIPHAENVEAVLAQDREK